MKLIKNNVIVRFIYKLIHKIKKKIIIYHQRILITKETDLDKKFNRNFYDVFIDWIQDIIQYGTLLAISLIIFNINITTLLIWIFPLGILRWLVFDTITTYKKIK